MYRIHTIHKRSKVHQYRIVSDIAEWQRENPDYNVTWWARLDNGEPIGKEN